VPFTAGKNRTIGVIIMRLHLEGIYNDTKIFCKIITTLAGFRCVIK
jgi:hypothetical protein